MCIYIYIYTYVYIYIYIYTYIHTYTTNGDRASWSICSMCIDKYIHIVHDTHICIDILEIEPIRIVTL